jgi:hypothetical protein
MATHLDADRVLDYRIDDQSWEMERNVWQLEICKRHQFCW